MDRFQELLQRYIANTASAEEEREFLALVKSGKYNHLLDPEILSELRPTQKDLPDADQVSIERVYRKITTMPRRQTSRIVEFRRPRVWLAAAAVIVFAMVIGAVVTRVSFSPKQSLSLLQEHRKITYTGAQLVLLPDGTQVTLNKESELSFDSATFGEGSRKVWLKGEGFFDVAHDQSRPFKVRTGKVVTTVLGTAFNINTSGNGKITVTVTRGKVSVGDEIHTYGTIIANEQIAVNVSSNEFVKQTVDSTDAIAWRKSYFILDNVTFDEAARLIEKRFNVSVTIANESLKHCMINAWFVNNEDVTEIVESLSIAKQATVTRGEEGIIITGGTGCK